MYNLSIIIPIYNVEKYLEECIESICKQYREDIQIICVDDCSKDNSFEILKSMSRRYPFINIYQNSSNIGLASTRNVGLSKASGKYVMFVDSDDYVAKKIWDLIEITESAELDILLFSIMMFPDVNYNASMDFDRRVRKNKYIDGIGVNIMNKLIENKEMFGAVWGGIYRRAYLNEYNFRFIDGILHEDIPYTFALMLNAKRVKVINDVVYYYRQRENSILHTPNYNARLEGLVIGYIDMLGSWCQYNKKHQLESKYILNYLAMHEKLIENRYMDILVSGEVIENDAIKFIVQKIGINNDLNHYFNEVDIERIKKSTSIGIYGAGNIAKKIMMSLRANDILVKDVFVTDTNDNAPYFFGLKVQKFKAKKMENNDCLIVAISANNQNEVLKNFNTIDSVKIIKTVYV